MSPVFVVKSLGWAMSSLKAAAVYRDPKDHAVRQEPHPPRVPKILHGVAPHPRPLSPEYRGEGDQITRDLLVAIGYKPHRHQLKPFHLTSIIRSLPHRPSSGPFTTEFAGCNDFSG